MVLKITGKILRENAFEQKEKKPGLNLTLGKALIGLRKSGPRFSLRIPSHGTGRIFERLTYVRVGGPFTRNHLI